MSLNLVTGPLLTPNESLRTPGFSGPSPNASVQYPQPIEFHAHIRKIAVSDIR